MVFDLQKGFRVHSESVFILLQCLKALAFTATQIQLHTIYSIASSDVVVHHIRLGTTSSHPASTGWRGEPHLRHWLNRRRFYRPLHSTGCYHPCTCKNTRCQHAFHIDRSDFHSSTGSHTALQNTDNFCCDTCLHTFPRSVCSHCQESSPRLGVTCQGSSRFFCTFAQLKK